MTTSSEDGGIPAGYYLRADADGERLVPMPDAPGPAPDRAVLARAEADWRATPPDLAGWVALSRDASQALMAEYDRRGAELDRQRALIAAVLAACSEAEAVAGWNTARVTVAEIRALLEGEEKP